MARMRRLPAVADGELDFQGHLLLALGRHPQFRVHRQNVGSVPVRDARGRVIRYFHAGPPEGASDLSGIVRAPADVAGLRLEVELKFTGGTRSPAQIAWAEHITRSGGVYVLVAYDAARSLTDNVAAAVRAIESAIDARRPSA